MIVLSIYTIVVYFRVCNRFINSIHRELTDDEKDGFRHALFHILSSLAWFGNTCFIPRSFILRRLMNLKSSIIMYSRVSIDTVHWIYFLINTCIAIDHDKQWYDVRKNEHHCIVTDNIEWSSLPTNGTRCSYAFRFVFIPERFICVRAFTCWVTAWNVFRSTYFTCAQQRLLLKTSYLTKLVHVRQVATELKTVIYHTRISRHSLTRHIRYLFFTFGLWRKCHSQTRYNEGTWTNMSFSLVRICLCMSLILWEQKLIDTSFKQIVIVDSSSAFILFSVHSLAERYYDMNSFQGCKLYNND
jgi:hypothetical protein